MSDLISRAAAIDALKAIPDHNDGMVFEALSHALRDIELLPSVQPTLYGYKIEHLAYIARVMEKEGVTADYAVRTFDDMSRAIKMIIEEAQQKVEEALNG